MNMESFRHKHQHLWVKQPLILVVDDDEDSLLLLSQILKVFGFACINTLQGQTVLNLAKRYQPDLILLDVVLRDISGVEVIQQLKQHPQTQAIPVIAVTALARVEDREQILQLGWDDYISKPYTLEGLEGLIYRTLNQIGFYQAS
ncbi:response regulator [Trichocoleus sp. FACHB-591]|uniref:response regulator n=1 Tax=Trichocoleus sp. FACHB-591 TaxID=2692872 RepID=UPI001F54AF64|nr:response regulator [Trichocoleus sp. FACHB-591]